METEKFKSYRNALIIGFTSIVNVLFSIIKNKVLAIYMGPSGMGTLSALNSVLSFSSTLLGFGVSNSGVQSIAKTDDNQKVRDIYFSLKSIYTIIFILGYTTLFFTSDFLSNLVVNDSSLVWSIRIVGLGIFFRLRSFVQNAIIIGLNRVNELAKSNVFNGLLVTLISVPLALYLGKRSIPFIVVLVPFVSWSISAAQLSSILRNFPKEKSFINSKEIKYIFSIGIATLLGGLFESGLGIFTKLGILRVFGNEYLGLYHISVGISLIYLNFVTSSITSDYYPRLVSKVKNNESDVFDFVNEQISLVMSLLVPILTCLLLFRENLVIILYSNDFIGSQKLLGLCLFGSFFRVLAWPVAYVILASNAVKTFVLSELGGNVVHLGVILFALYQKKFIFVGYALVVTSLFYLFLVFTIYFCKYKGHLSAKVVLKFVINTLILFCAHALYNTGTLRLFVLVVLMGVQVYMNKTEIISLWNRLKLKANG